VKNKRKKKTAKATKFCGQTSKVPWITTDAGAQVTIQGFAGNAAGAQKMPNSFTFLKQYSIVEPHFRHTPTSYLQLKLSFNSCETGLEGA
jgi:hypothetical protein